MHLFRLRARKTFTAAATAAVTLAGFASVASVATPLAHAENNGVGATPAMGWSSWSYIRSKPTEAKIEAQADAMKSSGLTAVGYNYVNVDDFWYQCPGSQGPNVDANGRWVIDTTKFPDSGGMNGIAATAAHVHGEGLQFGLYVTPGVSSQAVAQKSKILGTNNTVDQIATTTAEKNYNCKGMVGIDYTKPGAQAFINSWANEFASWGVDYIKIDGVGTSDVPDLQAWSAALQQTGRPIHLELSNNLAIASASTWQQYSNGWRTGGDIECYCGTNGAVYPLTNWAHVQSRFAQVANWQPYGGPGAFNDYDSIEVGNGSNGGLTPAERQSQMSLWALAASPFILGTDLTNLDATDLGYLKNTAVIAVDQDAIDAKRIVNSSNQQVYSKTEKNGDIIVGLFNYSDTASQTDTVNLSTAGLNGSGTAVDLWTGNSIGTVSGNYSVTLGAGAVQLLRITPSGTTSGGSFEAESSANTLSGAAKVATCTACSGGQKVGYIGNGSANTLTYNNVRVGTAGTYAVAVGYCDGSTTGTGRQATISVNGGTAQTVQFNPTGGFSTPGSMTVNLALNAGVNTITIGNPTAYAPDMDEITVPASPIPPANDFSVALSPTAGSVTAGGATTATVSTAVTAGSAQSVSLAASGVPSGVTVSFSPSSVTAGSSATMNVSTASSTAAGTYSITVTGTAASGSHSATYSLTVKAQTTTTSYEAESASNTLAGGAKVSSCTACSGGQKVGYVGKTGTLTFNGVSASAAGSYTLTISYCDGSTTGTGRQADLTVNGGTAQLLQFTPTGSFSTPGTMTVTVTLKAGTNTIEFSNPSAYAPDFDKIAVTG